MAENLRARPLYLLTAILTVWTTGQFWLCRNAAHTLNAAAAFAAQRIETEHPSTYVRLDAIGTSVWLRAGLESVAAVLLPTIVAVFLVAGGRRWLAAVVAAYPAANVLGGFHDGASLGLGWDQPTAVQLWFTYGVIVDSALLLLIVGLLVKAMPERPEPGPTRWNFLRVVPCLIVLAGWWVTRHPAPTGHDWVWLGDAVTFTLVAALLADSVLPPAARAVSIGLVLPLATGTILNDLIAPGQIGFPATYFAHHALIAIGTAMYVTGAPKAFNWLVGATPATAT
ncbi:MAG TPA: hypothetical protein VG899_03980 [Mycobacteriales bacterium]|nr:hypothetical protein [Mycobacteriales bacterium]